MGLCPHSQLRIILSAVVMGYALKQFNQSNNAVTVKGLAEKPIQADSARWEISLQTSRYSNSVTEAYQLLDQEMKSMQNALQHGFTSFRFANGQ